MKVAITSFAHTHALGYSRLLAAMPGVELLTCDAGEHPPEELRGRALADELGVPYVDDRDALWDWGPDAVVVTSENARHRADVEQAAAVGAHILCEKPLATTWSDGLAIRDAVERAGVTLMVAFPVRFSPAFERVRAEYRSGALGELIAIRGNNNGKLPAERAWFADPELSGGGALVDHVVHIADLVEALSGAAPRRVTAVSNQILHRDRGTETGALSTVEYDDGTIAAIDSSWNVPPGAPAWGGLWLSVLGSRGTVDLDLFDTAVRGIDRSGRSLEHRYGSDLDARMLAVFLDAVRQGGHPDPSLRSGLRTLSVVLAAQESARTGRRVDIVDLLGEGVPD